MDTPLPSNKTLIEFSEAIPWQKIEDHKQLFNQKLKELAKHSTNNKLPLETLADAIRSPITTYHDINDTDHANILLARHNERAYILGSVVSHRYRRGKTILKSIVPYNMNPSVNHTNIHETDDAGNRIRALGAELELGLLKADGTSPSTEEVNAFFNAYKTTARRLGITPQVDREACEYQIEAHVAPGVGYHRTRKSLEGIMTALTTSSEKTGLNTAIMSCYPIESNFKLADDPKVHTAVDLMIETNGQFPEYIAKLEAAKKRYHISSNASFVEVFRLQGCHIHLDLAGRSEALALLAFHTVLRSATAIANGAVLKGGPFVNGTCDAELLCAREYLRRTTVTGRHIVVPRSPHLIDGDLERYATLLDTERANAVARALLWDGRLASPISAMHNPIGRIRPDLGGSKRICTVESTGMPINVSASRQAAILTDFEFTHALIEAHFRKHGCNLEPLFEDQELWAILGPLSEEHFTSLQDASDRHCTDITLQTAAGTAMTLADFYEMKRLYMHRNLPEATHITPRDIDEVYMSLQRMLAPPSGQVAQTIEQYIHDYKLRSTGNWGKIMRNAFIEAGGTPGEHNPDVVLKVVNRIHDAVRKRYLQVQ